MKNFIEATEDNSLEEIFSIIKHNHDNFVEWLQDYQGVENGTT